MDMKGKIRVYCRVRPFNLKEREEQQQDMIRIVDDRKLVLFN